MQLTHEDLELRIIALQKELDKLKDLFQQTLKSQQELNEASVQTMRAMTETIKSMNKR